MQVVGLIHQENGVFGVSFPDFPGCVTAADSADEAVSKAAEALAFHVEGLAEDGALPTPRSLSRLFKDDDFRAEAEQALVILVPYQPPSRAVRINITLDESLLQRLDQAAQLKGETRSGYIADAVRQRMSGGPSTGAIRETIPPRGGSHARSPRRVAGRAGPKK